LENVATQNWLSTLSTLRVPFHVWFESHNMSTCPDEFGNRNLYAKARMAIGPSKSSVARIFCWYNLDEVFCTRFHGKHSSSVSQVNCVQWHAHTFNWAFIAEFEVQILQFMIHSSIVHLIWRWVLHRDRTELSRCIHEIRPFMLEPVQANWTRQSSSPVNAMSKYECL
jgi:hypothetical protein